MSVRDKLCIFMLVKGSTAAVKVYISWFVLVDFLEFCGLEYRGEWM